MTTAALAAGNRAMDNVVRPRRSLEELVDQLMAALKFGDDDGTAERSAARTIHEARRLRQAGDVDGALAVLAEVDTARTDRTRPGGPFPSGSSWSSGGSATGTRWSTAREPGGPPRWFPAETGPWRWSRCWGCAGGPARSSRVAASGACGRWPP